MGWINKNDKLPDKTKKYLVIIDCEGVLKESYCTFNIKKQKFHFDMAHISWNVVAWFDLPKFDNGL